MPTTPLKRKTVNIRPWEQLKKEYEPTLHPVMTDPAYRDKVTKKGIERVTRITLALQKLAVKRMTELLFSIPVKRIYKPRNDREKTAARIIEDVYNKNRIDGVNIERGRALFAACEAMTIWYAVAQPVKYAGEASPIKIRCKTFSPITGDKLYPLFDDYGDMVALSVEYNREETDPDGRTVTVTYFDSYTADSHTRYRTEGGSTEKEIEEPIELMKIPGVYISRHEPIWEDQSPNIYEAEWTLSRNGNYIRKNARPNWVVFSDNKVRYGGEPSGDNAGRNVLQYGQGDKAEYKTWTQAIDSIKFHIGEIYRNFFTCLQLPDMSFDSMKATPMSGEARKMMFIDAQMKANDESGIWLEFFDRELNVIRAFLKKAFPALSDALDSLQVETEITPYKINDEAERINNLHAATGNKAIMSRLTAIRQLSYVDDAEAELKQISEEENEEMF